VKPAQGEHFELGPAEERTLCSFDCVMMRKDPPFDMAYVMATYLLERTPASTLVMNHPQGLRDANEKLFATRMPELMPPTIVTTDKGAIRAFVEEQGGEAVIKPLDGAGGEGVFYLHGADRNLNVIIETVTAHGARMAMVQRYIPEIVTSGDRRVIVLDGEPLGVVARLPPAGELRGNIHVGGRVERAEITDRIRAICAALAPLFRETGLWFVGLDVIGDYLTEVNVTSPTGIQEVNRLDGVRLEARVMDFVERRCRALRSHVP
jgi:glutathione synthase